MRTKPKIFIDGEAGTTGLQIAERLAAFDAVDVISIADAVRKDGSARRTMFAEADVAILCLPDDAAREAVALIDTLGSDAPRIIDASTAHRTADGWVYGFAELDPNNNQAKAIAAADRVANVGCYATAAIALLRPLLQSPWFAPDHPFTINAVSGYTGGGKAMIAEHDAGTAPAFQLYGLGLNHKHLPEIVQHAGLSRAPLFVPSVGNFPQGMLVSVPLPLSMLAAQPTLGDLRAEFKAYYKSTGEGVRYIEDRPTMLAADFARDSDGMEIFVFGDDAGDHALLVARLDNLGKGAAGAAVQNMRLMLDM